MSGLAWFPRPWVEERRVVAGPVGWQIVAEETVGADRQIKWNVYAEFINSSNDMSENPKVPPGYYFRPHDTPEKEIDRLLCMLSKPLSA